MSDEIKVLIIDDAVFILHAAQLLLEREGFVVRTASNPLRGMAIWKSWRPDCVLLDLMMPGKSGWEVMDEMADEEARVGVPVFVFTAKDDPEAKKEARRRGASGYILKPFEAKELARIMRKAVAKARAASSSCPSERED